MREEFQQEENWYSRFLPHYNENGKYQMITYRLNDSLPKEVWDKLGDNSTLIEANLDQGFGSCLLKNPQYSQIVVDNWLHFHNERYELIAYVVMPNHVHVLIKVLNDWQLSKIVFSWKKYTAKKILEQERRKGNNLTNLWNREYWDRFIRDGNHYMNSITYILNNPVKAGLVKTPKEWKFLGYNKDYLFED